MRKNEIIDSKTEWFDLRAGLLHLIKHAGIALKDNEERTTPLTETFRSYLKKFELSDPYIIAPDTKKGRSRCRYDFKRPFAEYIEEKGCPWIRGPKTSAFDRQPNGGKLLFVENRIPLVDAFFLGCEEVVCWIEDFDFRDRVAHADRVDHILALRGESKDRVASVQVRSGHMGNEKLAAVCSWTRVRHGEDARLVVLQAGFELVFKTVARPPTASSGGIAALNHELGNHAVERDAVIVSAIGQVEEVGHGHGCCRRLKGGLDRAFISFNDDADVLHGGSVCR